MTVAQKWLEDQGLPEAYREQVVDFLVQNTGGAARPAAQTDLYQNVDPFTGGGAYQPGGARGGAAAPASGLRHVPKTGYFLYDTVPPENLRKKILEFWAEVDGGVADADARVLDELLAVVREVSRYHVAKLGAPACALLERLLRWPREKLFPIIDIVRMLVLIDDGAAHFADAGGRLLRSVVSSAFAPETPEPTKLVALRLLCNCFKHRGLLQSAAPHFAEIMNGLSSLAESGRKNVRLALANLMMNMSVFCADGAREAHHCETQCASLAVEILKHAQAEDAEAAFRALVSVGTLVLRFPEVKQLMQAMEVKALVAKYATSGGKLAEAASDVSSLL